MEHSIFGNFPNLREFLISEANFNKDYDTLHDVFKTFKKHCIKFFLVLAKNQLRLEIFEKILFPLEILNGNLIFDHFLSDFFEEICRFIHPGK